ncbi:MAG: flagellar basal body-associated FliL family protein, partial [Planctomycetaceae bacterium]|nr:flagellar basal body-associated FliL family protein [Planctomycetaceae bacterium]
MAEEDKTDETATPVGRKGPGLLIWAVLGAVAAGGGFAVPFLLPSGDASKSATAGSESRGLKPSVPKDLAFIPFGDVTVNLDDGRLTRYLHLSFSLQVEKTDQLKVTKLVEDHKAILRNWLLSFLSDKGMDDIRGAAGQNRIRREIQDQFNTILFPDGYDRIYDVLFEEFNV